MNPDLTLAPHALIPATCSTPFFPASLYYHPAMAKHDHASPIHRTNLTVAPTLSRHGSYVFDPHNPYASPASLYFGAGTAYERKKGEAEDGEYTMTVTDRRIKCVIATSEPLSDKSTGAAFAFEGGGFPYT
jgi:hypothetical protein